jgi:hypothetical protein
MAVAKGRVLTVVVAMALLAAFAAEAGADPGQAETTIVLNTYGVWRFHCTLGPPVLASGETVQLRHVWLNYATAGPADGWMQPDFDDISWDRGPVSLAVKSALVSRLCVRGKFTVADPSAVSGLALSVGYRGGLVVYVNGTEVHREHIQQGQTLAEGPGGEERLLAALPIPAHLIRQGLNVIGLEIVRAPYPAQTEDNVYETSSCEILSARLTSAGPSGIVPKAVRPHGFQVWNADAMAGDVNVDFGDQAEPLRPVTIMGARNGSFTGKFVVGSDEAIEGLQAVPAEFRSPAGGTIPAANVRVRYGIRWGDLRLANAGNRRFPSPYPTWGANRLGALAEQPLGRFDVLVPERDPWTSAVPKDANEVKVVNAAVVPVWLTVKVPAGVPAGTYTGSVRVEAQGQEPVQVPLELRVADWALPDTQDFRTWVDMIECPDTLALEYEVPLWSDKHFDLIARSFKLIGETGSRTVYIPLIAHTNLGNEESYVRWIKQGDGYAYDFSVMDRYLDVATENMGKPKLVIFIVWDVYMVPPSDASEGQRNSRQRQMAEHVQKTAGSIGHGPMVTVLDPATQKASLETLPSHFDAEASRPLWEPLFRELRARMRQRGLEDAMMLGLQCDAWASKEEHQLFHDITGGLPWVLMSHEGFGANFRRMREPRNELMHGISEIGYQARVWAVTFSDDNADRPRGYEGGIKSQLGWARPDLVAQFDRFSRELNANVYWRCLPEATITGAQRGNGRLGAEYWKVVRDARGRRAGRSHERYPESTWRNLFIPEALLAPAPDGPAATDQLEAYREGVQECEARIVIERALNDEALRARIGPDLAGRCEDYLYNRHMLMWLSLSDLQLFYDHPGATWGPHYMAACWRGMPDIGGSHWFLASGWQERTWQLLSLAGEVTKTLEGK